MFKRTETVSMEIPTNLMSQWQSLVDVMMELADIPAGLIMRIVEEDIVVFLSSNNPDNPFNPGDREHLENSGLYCETVIRTRKPLHIPEALADPDWCNSAGVKLNMISYLGFPIMLPDNKPFGTLCILDNKANSHSETIFRLLGNFRDLIQSHLELVYMNSVLGEKNTSLSDYLDELQSLRGLIPMCAKCKKIRNSTGYWKSVEEYFINHPNADFTHGFCPDCFQNEREKMRTIRCAKHQGALACV